MGRNRGKWISRETNYLYNGDKAITDTFQMPDGTLVFHIYNVTADGSAHSHQVMDEYGNPLYARAISNDPDHPWIEINRPDYTYATRWLTTLTEEKLEKVLNVMDVNTLKLIIQSVTLENSLTNDVKREKELSL